MLREFITMAVLTGMRRGEIVNLQWCDVNLEGRLIHVHSTPTFRTKQGKQRSIPLHETCAAMLTKRKCEATSEYVFDWESRKRLESFVTHKFKDYARLAGLNERLHFHSLRHTFASWLVQDGASLFQVQKLLGHSDVTTTQIYSHLNPESLHDTVNKIGLLLS